MDAELSPSDGLAQLSFLVQGMLERRVDEVGISVVMGRMLGILRDRTPPMSGLGAYLGLDKSSISGLVQRAEKRGFVERFPSPDDRRAVLVRLTDAGRQAVAEGEAAFDADVVALLGHLSASDQAQHARLVSRMLEARAAASGIDLLRD